MEKQLLQLRPTEGRWIAQSGDLNRFLAVSENTGGAYAQWEGDRSTGWRTAPPRSQPGGRDVLRARR